MKPHFKRINFYCSFVIGIFLVACTAFLNSCTVFGGLTETEKKDSELIGATLTTNQRIYYMEQCNNHHSCGVTKTSLSVDRSLVCNELNSTITPIYNKSYEINYQTTFEVKKIIYVGCYGMMCGWGGEYELAVLEDVKGLRSLKLLVTIDFEGKNVCD